MYDNSQHGVDCPCDDCKRINKIAENVICAYCGQLMTDHDNKKCPASNYQREVFE